MELLTLLRICLIFVVFCAASLSHAAEMIPGPIEADVVKVRDGDSIDVVAHIWPGHEVRVSVRIRGIDAPELRARCPFEKAKARAARQRLRQLIGVEKIFLHRVSEGKYSGRVLSAVRTRSGEDVKSAMLESGHARPI